MVDINVDENITSFEKITLNSKSMNHLNTNSIFTNKQILYSTIKCYKSLPSITTFEANGKNIIKIHKTIYLNLINLTSIDLRDNKLQKISKNFRLFKNLKILKLDFNHITFIPSFINELNQLETFSISNNQLSFLPTTIQSLNKLKMFSFSNNKIENLPIEFGLLTSLEILYMDCNYFTSIPTTLCYLKKLNELSLDWLEFVEPPYFRNIKDSVGKTLITIIQKSLGNMLKQSILFCDFKTFIEQISPKKNGNISEHNNNQFTDLNDSMNNNSNNNLVMKNSSSQQGGASLLTVKSNNNNIYTQKYSKIFNAIENNYFGIVKSLLESENVEEYLTVKNIENKTPLYLSLTKSNDLIDLFLSKMKEKNIEINYTYLFKAIFMRNPELVKKLVNLGVKIDSIDDQGRGVFHILFNVFNNQLSKCVIIGDFLLSKNAPVNKFDNDNYAPIHVASRRGCKECLLWIISRNVYLAKEGREQFDLNLKGKKNCTPLYYTISNFRIEETLILLEHGCDIFARNLEAQTPKKISSSNFVFSKLLTHYESIILGKKYNIDDDEKKNNNDKKKICHTLLDEEVENTDNNMNIVTTMNNNKNIYFNNVENKDNNAVGKINYNINNIIIQNNYSININNNLVKNQKDTDLKKKNSENLLQISINNNQNNQNPTLQKMKTSDNIANFSKKDITPFVQSIEIIKNNNNIINATGSVEIHSNTINNENVCMNVNINNNITKVKNEKINNTKKENINNEQNNICDNSCNKSNLEIMNINNQKEILLSIDYSPFRKYKSLRIIKLNKSNDIDTIKNILDNIDLENSFNLMLLSDLCNYSIANLLFNIIPTFKKLMSNETIKKKLYIKNEINNTIELLEELSKNQNLNKIKKTQKLKKNIINRDTRKLNSSKKREDDENEKMFYQNSEEINNTDDIDDSVNNINFDEINNLFLTTNKTNEEVKNKNIEKNNKVKKNSKPLVVEVKIKEKKIVAKGNKFNSCKGNNIIRKIKKNDKNKKTFVENIKEIQAQLLKTDNNQQHIKQGSAVVKNNNRYNKIKK